MRDLNPGLKQAITIRKVLFPLNEGVHQKYLSSPTMRRRWSGSILLPLREVVLSTVLPHPKLIYYMVNILLISMF